MMISNNITMPSFANGGNNITATTPQLNETNFLGMFHRGLKAQSAIVIGAGAAGLTAAHDLIKAGIDVTVLEASMKIGGRLKKDETVADFPIDLGAEWIHVDPTILDTISGVNGMSNRIDTVLDDPRPTYEYTKDGSRTKSNISPFGYMFLDYTWFDFFNDHIASSFISDIQFGCQVTQINYRASTSKVKCADGRQYNADAVIVAVPLEILRDGDITFKPSLSKRKRRALQKIPTPAGIKVFIEFDHQFYPNGFWFEGEAHAETNERYFYNTAYEEDSDKNVMGVYIYGDDIAKPFMNKSDRQVVNHILSELNGAFGSTESTTATDAFTGKFVVQNWEKEEYIRGAFSRYNGKYKYLRRLAEPIGDKVFFAGEAFPVDWENGFAHGAAISGKAAAYQVIHGVKSATFLCNKYDGIDC